MIKNLIYDFGKVLVDYDFEHIIDQFFTDKAQEMEFCRLFTNQEFIDSCDKEDIPFSEIIANKKQEYPEFAPQIQLFYDRYVDFVTGEVPGMYEVLSELKEQGYRLYGLTNWCSVVHEVMRRYHIFELLDDRIISSEEHLIKPYAPIYQRLLDKFNLNAEECVFTDDKEINVRGAESVGIRGIVFRNATQYRQELDILLAKENR